EQAFWHALVRDSRMAGMENLAAALGSDPAERLQDWAGALYADDLVPGIEPRYALDSWNLRAIFPQAGSLGLGTFNQPYPLDVQQLRAWATPLQLQGGGAGYIQLVVARAQTVAVRYAQGS